VALFDDPAYFRALRVAMVPWLRSCPSPKLWLAECVCAEEACALAILLAEEGLLERTQIFATAQNETLLQEAGSGGFALECLPEYRCNYQASGGKAALDDYCSEQDGRLVFSAQLRSNITWAQYSLATDASFNEFQMILCRYALPGFGGALRRRALQLFHDSMPLFGLLGIGGPEGLDVAPFTARYQAISAEQGLYRRVA
jgi:chemotaxis protein methyltransferase CheR